ncbi:MAG: dephospho-CoA kinase [Clostridiales bacterium]|nr:dephospho-CoA kinase [Clostridiales bacterium]
MLLVGLTGQTGAGKSTVAAALEEKGYCLIDADLLARQVVEPGSETLKALAQEFGCDIIDSKGFLKRRLLAQRAFSKPEKTSRLNAITHPAITKKIRENIKKASKKGCSAAILDAALLFESGFAQECDLIALVRAPEEIRLQRIILRDGLTRQEALMRIKAQSQQATYAAGADFVIETATEASQKKGIKELEILIEETLKKNKSKNMNDEGEENE